MLSLLALGGGSTTLPISPTSLNSETNMNYSSASSDYPTKLSKRFFVTLPEGVFLVSNLYFHRGMPVFAEKTVPMTDREDQWKRIVSLGASQRNCRVFRSRADFIAWDAQLHEAVGRVYED